MIGRILEWKGMSQELCNTWNSVVDEVDLNPTLKPDWLEISRNNIDSGRHDLSVYIDEDDGGKPQAFVPFFRSKLQMAFFQLNCVQMASNLLSYHAALVARGEEESMLKRFLYAVPDWDVVQFGNLLADGPTADAIETVSDQLGLTLQVLPGESSPFIPITQNWEDFLAGKNKKFRYKFRKRNEILTKQPEYVVRSYRQQDGIQDLITAISEIEINSWKADKGLDIPSSRSELQYYAELIPALASCGRLLAEVLYVGDKPIAYSLCCSNNGWVGQLKTSFDTRFSEISAGSIVIDACIRHAFDAGASEFDFLGDAASHKLAWTSDLRKHAHYFLFSSRAKPSLVGKLKRLKQKLRKEPLI